MDLQPDQADFFADRITKEFPTPSAPLRVLDGITCRLNRGQNLAVVGPSGSGKSTFLHIAGTLDSPTSGKVRLLGSDLNALSPHQIAPFRNQHIGFIFQEHFLLPQLTALENVLIPLVANRKHSGTGSQQRAKSLLDRVGLRERMGHLPGQLSGGERQRVAVARALICGPELVLADEPTGSLDPNNADRIGQLLLDLQQQDQSILICVTHSERLAGLFQKQVRLVDGKFV